ncbi:MAG TPA: crotonase/enoyl-CoA hydratase family protein [Jatrophihabitantaceae bacterium]|jgi:enoyl-CoA hydratase|nr:crotonase/enoyl-CoA hydratase family protein [Jatrophihabitantaceae bacterium]
MTESRNAVAGLPPEMLALRVELAGHIAEVTMLGPSKGNAMGPDFWRELPLVFAALDADPTVRAVVLTGSGANFSYGLDLPAMMGSWAELLQPGAQAAPRTEFLAVIKRLQAAISSLAGCRKPVIAAVAGWCIGGGVDLISSADVRLASADAKFSVREVRLAIVADIGSLQRLSGIIGEGALRELALTGKDIDADRALRIGLVNEVLPDQNSLLVAARAMAADIAAQPPLSVQGTKQILNEQREAVIAAGLRHVAVWNAAFMPSADLAEAMTAFLQRRPPDFTGR